MTDDTKILSSKRVNEAKTTKLAQVLSRKPEVND